ncbi:hypothetical protein [Alicyclobacillus fastidiosus]|uniref:hypothetical protein n=1 Tax=Alicyclobacillus fastidiosus TaxID=392011 RepID=UPI0024E11745|nr:hypothetical protein [Alicyclobacillus fastidiosus]
MTEHYYSAKPQVESQQRTIEVDVRGVHLKLTTDRGVFSKGARRRDETSSGDSRTRRF